MPRSGTTKSDIRSRRAGSEKTARLNRVLRRAGFVLGGGALLTWLCAWLVLSGAAERGIRQAEQALYGKAADKGFVIQNVLVEGRQNTDPEVLRALIDVERGDPLFAFDPAEARDLIERLSWVKQAHVERRLPDTVYIGLRERRPLALWQHKGKIRLIDDEGVTLADKGLEEFADLLIIVGDEAPEQAPDLVRMLEAEAEVKGRVEAATWVGERRWDLKLKNGATVRLPERDMGLALARLAKAQAEDGLLDKDLSVIDLRESDRITVRTRPGAVQEYKVSAGKGSDI